MRYLRITRTDGIYDYIPLDIIEFNFIEIDDREYRIELMVGNHTIATIEKLNCDPDTFMQQMSVIRSYITDFGELF
jgi:hypothetical protein